MFDVIKKVINSKMFDVISRIYLTLILFLCFYCCYEKWITWVFLIVWLIAIFPVTSNIFYKLLKKFIDRNKNISPK